MVRCRRYRGRPGEFLCKTNVFEKFSSRGVTDSAFKCQARVLCCRFLESMQSVGLDLVVSVDMSTGGGGMDSKRPYGYNDLSSLGRISLINNPGCFSSSLISVHVVLCSSCLITRRNLVDIARTVVCNSISYMNERPSPVLYGPSPLPGARSSHSAIVGYFHVGRSHVALPRAIVCSQLCRLQAPHRRITTMHHVDSDDIGLSEPNRAQPIRYI